MSTTPILLRRPLHSAEPAAEWPTGYRLVPFEPHLAPAAHALLADAYNGGGGGVPAAHEDWWQAVRSDAEFDPLLCFLVVDESDEPAAFALCWTSSFIKDIAVAPAYRRQGVASALLTTIFATLAMRGFNEVRLKVQADNSRAQAIYARLGFVPA